MKKLILILLISLISIIAYNQGTDTIEVAILYSDTCGKGTICLWEYGYEINDYIIGKFDVKRYIGAPRYLFKGYVEPKKCTLIWKAIKR